MSTSNCSSRISREFLRASPRTSSFVQGDRYGRLALTDMGLRRRERHVLETCRRAGLPVAITIAGGYAATPERTAELHAIVFEEARAQFG